MPLIQVHKRSWQKNMLIRKNNCRQIRQENFQKFDWIIGMDQSNVADLKQLAPIEAQEKIQLFFSPVIGKKAQKCT